MSLSVLILVNAARSRLAKLTRTSRVNVRLFLTITTILPPVRHNIRGCRLVVGVTRASQFCCRLSQLMPYSSRTPYSRLALACVLALSREARLVALGQWWFWVMRLVSVETSRTRIDLCTCDWTCDM